MESTQTRDRGAPVWRIFQSIGAPAAAITWAKGYDRDLKRAWNECMHGELMLPVAAGLGADPTLVALVGHDCIRSTLDGYVDIKEAFEVLDATKHYASGDMCNGDFADALKGGSHAALTYDAKGIKIGAVAVRMALSIGGAALFLGTGRGNQGLRGFHEGLISAAKIRLLFADEKDELHHNIRVAIVIDAMREFAYRTRQFIPWNALPCAVLAKALRSLQEEGNVGLRC